MPAPDTFLTLAQLGQHSTAVRQQAQSIAVAVLIARAPCPCDDIEAQIAELEADCGALCAALRLHLGVRCEVEQLLEREVAA